MNKSVQDRIEALQKIQKSTIGLVNEKVLELLYSMWNENHIQHIDIKSIHQILPDYLIDDGEKRIDITFKRQTEEGWDMEYVMAEYDEATNVLVYAYGSKGTDVDGPISYHNEFVSGVGRNGEVILVPAGEEMPYYGKKHHPDLTTLQVESLNISKSGPDSNEIAIPPQITLNISKEEVEAIADLRREVFTPERNFSTSHKIKDFDTSLYESVTLHIGGTGEVSATIKCKNKTAWLEASNLGNFDNIKSNNTLFRPEDDDGEGGGISPSRPNK